MYQYDLFLSYKRGKIKEEWLNDIFYPLFVEHLSEAIGHEPSIFLDKEDINPGIAWENKLKDALSKSKCMAAILSPTYFNSAWCAGEFQAMLMRQEQLIKSNTIKADQALLVPLVKQGPTDKFPNHARRLQLLDYTRYNKVGEAFKDSKEYLELQEKIQQDARQIAKMVEDAPGWSAAFVVTDFPKMINDHPVIQSQPTF